MATWASAARGLYQHSSGNGSHASAPGDHQASTTHLRGGRP
jgi:hypothetical protein